MDTTINILFTEDKELYRKMILAELEEANIRCIGEADNGKELLRQLKTKKPDVILLDLEMPVMDGNEAMNRIIKDFPEAKVLIMSLHCEEELIEDYIKRGAKGYVSKDAICGNITLLIDAIQKIHAGGIYKQTLPKPDRKKFTARQKEMIPLICDEMTNKEIAEELKIKERTVEKHRQKIYSRTNSSGATSFLKYAFKRGLDFLGRKFN